MAASTSDCSCSAPSPRLHVFLHLAILVFAPNLATEVFVVFCVVLRISVVIPTSPFSPPLIPLCPLCFSSSSPCLCLSFFGGQLYLTHWTFGEYLSLSLSPSNLQCWLAVSVVFPPDAFAYCCTFFMFRRGGRRSSLLPVLFTVSNFSPHPIDRVSSLPLKSSFSSSRAREKRTYRTSAVSQQQA